MRRRMLALAVAAVLAAGACGGEGDLHVIPPGQLPEDIYASPTPTAPAATQRVSVYFVADGRLIPLERVARGASGAAEFAMRELLAGPREEDGEAVATAIPDGTEILGVSVSDGVAAVNLSREFELSAAQEVLLLRLSQVVYTLTELPRVQSVRFLIDSEPVDVVDEDGIVVAGPVARDDYARVAPLRQEDQAAGVPDAAGGPAETSGPP